MMLLKLRRRLRWPRAGAQDSGSDSTNGDASAETIQSSSHPQDSGTDSGTGDASAETVPSSRRPQESDGNRDDASVETAPSSSQQQIFFGAERKKRTSKIGRSDHARLLVEEKCPVTDTTGVQASSKGGYFVYQIPPLDLDGCQGTEPATEGRVGNDARGTPDSGVCSDPLKTSNVSSCEGSITGPGPATEERMDNDAHSTSDGGDHSDSLETSNLSSCEGSITGPGPATEERVGNDAHGTPDGSERSDSSETSNASHCEGLESKRGDGAQGTLESGHSINNSLTMRKVSRGKANEVSQIYLVPSPECWESTESLIGDLYATENARPLWRCAPTDVITELFADQANQPAVLFTANAALLFLLVEQSELIDNVMYDCREAITELYRRWISMGQVPQLERASVLEHDGIRAVVMATGRVDHIPGAFVQFFHMEKEEVSHCWTIVRSEMCCTRIGNVR